MVERKSEPSLANTSFIVVALSRYQLRFLHSIQEPDSALAEPAGVANFALW